MLMANYVSIMNSLTEVHSYSKDLFDMLKLSAKVY
jgi:hypothetical protein